MIQWAYGRTGPRNPAAFHGGCKRQQPTGHTPCKSSEPACFAARLKSDVWTGACTLLLHNEFGTCYTYLCFKH